MKTKVLIAEDHELMRDALRRSLLKCKDLRIVGFAGDGLEAVSKVRKYKPDVVLMDIKMPKINGIEATRRLLVTRPKTKVIAVSSYSDPALVKGMFEAGGAGYILKDCNGRELAEAIRTVLSGRFYIGKSVTGVVVSEWLRPPQLKPVQDKTAKAMGLSSKLTAREKQVLGLLADGETDQLVADRLGIAASTVGAHRRKIMTKLQVQTIAGLTKYAVRAGLTSA